MHGEAPQTSLQLQQPVTATPQLACIFLRSLDDGVQVPPLHQPASHPSFIPHTDMVGALLPRMQVHPVQVAQQWHPACHGYPLNKHMLTHQHLHVKCRAFSHSQNGLCMVTHDKQHSPHDQVYARAHVPTPLLYIPRLERPIELGHIQLSSDLK